MEWISENDFELNGVKFHCALDVDGMFGKKSDDSFLIAKSRTLLERHQLLLESLKPQNIFELGIFRGGSTVWLNELFQPNKLVAIDFKDKPVKQLEAYLDADSRRKKVRACYGIDQKDIPTLAALYQEEFSGNKLDLVVDDASHFLDETRQSFNFLFPLLRSGGLFVVEDWAWSHDPIIDDERVAKQFVGKPPLSALLMEIMMAVPRLDGFIKEVYFDKNSAYIVRGDKDIAGDVFDISSSYTIHEGWRLSEGVFIKV